ncbi:unnamed protein product, partial [Didymodactylos carnosus]
DINDDEIEHNNHKYDQDFDAVMEAIADAYSRSEHWSTKRQILPVVAADLPYRKIQGFIPDLTNWKFIAARKEAHFKGRGATVVQERSLT